MDVHTTGISIRLQQYYLCESEKEKVHDDRRVAKGLLS